VRLILAFAVLVASLGVATSGHLPVPRDVRISDTSGRPDHEFTAIASSPIRWSSAAHKKRTTPTPIGGHPAVLTATVGAPCPTGWVATVSPTPAVHAGSAASCPASPRAPPGLPS
jgi:hypothetical protein